MSIHDQENDQDENKYDIQKLNELYRDGETCDSDVLAEMRSNILMMSGQHYKKITRGLSRNMETVGTDKSKRIRLVKNHTAKAMSDAKDILASLTPGVLPYPRHEHEPSSQKAAEISKAVWEKAQDANNFDELKETLRNSFMVCGEGVSKVFFDPIKGGLKAYKQKTDPEGRPVFLQGEQEVVLPEGLGPENAPELGLTEAPDKDQPVFKGQVTVEKIEPYNLLRPKNSKSIRSAKWLCIRKMVDIQDAKALIKSAQGLTAEEKTERLKHITESSETTYKIFDGTTGSFQDSDGQIMFREFYFRQSPEFPRGRFFICVESGILFEDDLPFGEHGEVAYPIKWAGYDMYEGSARGFSLIKRIKPCQIEINRCSSSISEVQVVMGWDKIVLTKNAKFSRGTDQPGMRVFHTTDGAPIVIPGRAGEQFTSYLEHNVAELYRLANIPENANPTSQATDPRAELFKKQSQKSRFTEPASRLARLYMDICETVLFFESKYMAEDEVVNAVGKKHAIDIAEFKNLDRIDYKVKLMEVSDDLDSMLGKTLEIETIIQYMGKNLDPETSKILISQFPMLNKSQSLKHLLLDVENVQSDILALDRGEWREASKYDDHPVFVKHLTNRIKQRDFQTLSPELQQMFMDRKAQHEEFIASLAKEEQEAAAGFIPSGGALAKADLYIQPDPNNPHKTQRAVFPTEALEWLKKRLDAQGSAQDLLQTIANQGAQAEIASLVGGGSGVGANPEQSPQTSEQEFNPYGDGMSPMPNEMQGAI